MSKHFDKTRAGFFNKILFLKQDMPPLSMRLCHSHCDLDLYPTEPKIDREHLLSMTNVCMKFKKAEPNITLKIDRTMLYMMDRPTDRQVPTLLGGHVGAIKILNPFLNKLRL